MIMSYSIILLLLSLHGVYSSTQGISICPQDMVYIEKEAYCIDKYEYPNIIGKYPRVDVDWFKAVALCKEKGKRLCSAQEWLYACRGPKNYKFPYGDKYIKGKCRSAVRYNSGFEKIGYDKGCFSEFGVYDMTGNVWEWTGISEKQAAIRGGSWYDPIELSDCQSVTWEGHTGLKYHAFGFRCCKDVKNEQPK